MAFSEFHLPANHPTTQPPPTYTIHPPGSLNILLPTRTSFVAFVVLLWAAGKPGEVAMGKVNF